ncbi:hypothetical protein [Pseudomonas sp. NPDC089547]|uniref:hypothetical protein n=1 Tax=Pseudomonas sp. NPDC089547 TaxID=3390652 RepID=UPI003D02F601
MRLNNLFALLLLGATSAQADLEIQSQADNPRQAEMVMRLRAATAGRPPSTASFPSQEQTIASIERAKGMRGLFAHAPTFQSPSRSAIEQLDCQLSIEAPAGVERKVGGLNGVQSVYACGTSYVVTYEYNYAVALTQRVRVIDDDFAKQTDLLNPLIKVGAVTKGETRMTHLRWLSPKNEISYEVYTDVSHADGKTLEKALESVLKATALRLSKAGDSVSVE